MIRLKVKEIAGEKHISMRKLSKNAGIAYNTLRTIYHDPYRSISTDTLDRIAQVLQVNASELLESVPDVRPLTNKIKNKKAEDNKDEEIPNDTV